MAKGLSVNDLIEAISGTASVLGSPERNVCNPSSIDGAEHDSFTFCREHGRLAAEKIRNTKASTIICHPDIELEKDDLADKTLILTQNPRLALIEILRKHFEKRGQFGFSPLAVISDRAEIHPNVSIGPYSCIGDCKIGEGTVIYSHVYVNSGIEIGRNVTVHPGTTIGTEDSFAYERNDRGELIRFPHLGGVRIEDDVEIHAHVNIDRGTFGNTMIGTGTKINRYAHIGHNCVIGKHCQIGGQVFIAGSCEIGDYSELALCCCVRNRTKLGKNVMVGMGSVVTKDVADHWIVYGVPAQKVRKNRIPPWLEKRGSEVQG